MATGYAGDSRLSTAKTWKQRRAAERPPGGPHAPPAAAAALPAPQNRGITTIPAPPGSGEHLKTTQEPPSSTQHATRALRLERPHVLTTLLCPLLYEEKERSKEQRSVVSANGPPAR